MSRVEDVLRPSAEQALEAWGALVRADAAQVEALRERPRPPDFYAPVAEMFRADPRRTDEPVLEALRTLVRSDETWLDLGAGGGRYSLAIALRANRVYAVEPSDGMRQVLAESMRDNDIENIDVFAERWPGPTAAPVADVGFISHVGYDIADIGPFLQQLEGHARRMCVAVMFDEAPISVFAPLWEPVHGEPRSLLPGLREFVALLFALGRSPELRLFPVRARVFEDVESLHAAARRPTWVIEGTEEDRRLGEAVRGMAVKVEGGVTLSTRERNVGLVNWRPTAPS